MSMPLSSSAAASRSTRRLAAECAAIGRDPAQIETSVNLGFYMDGREPPPHLVAGALTGSSQQAIDRLGEYADVGVGGVNLAFRPPIDFDVFEAFIEQVLPAFHSYR